jgi:hypothetical protein
MKDHKLEGEIRTDRQIHADRQQETDTRKERERERESVCANNTKK